MPVGEEKELRELVSDTLQAKGVLGKVQAEIRASVFLALEEQDIFKDKSPFINQPLKDFVKTSDGLIALSLIKEFLDFFNLEFTSMVFDPETHAGIDYVYEGRTKLANDLMLNENEQNKLPLLSSVLALLKCSNLRKENPEMNLVTSERSSNGINGTSPQRSDVVEDVLSAGDAQFDTRLKTSNKPKEHTNESLASLSNLPPLKKTAQSNGDASNLTALIDQGLNDESSSESEIAEEILSHISTGSAAPVSNPYHRKNVNNALPNDLFLFKPGSGKPYPYVTVKSKVKPFQFVPENDDSDTSRSLGPETNSKCDTISEVDEIEDIAVAGKKLEFEESDPFEYLNKDRDISFRHDPIFAEPWLENTATTAPCSTDQGGIRTINLTDTLSSPPSGTSKPSASAPLSISTVNLGKWVEPDRPTTRGKKLLNVDTRKKSF